MERWTTRKLLTWTTGTFERKGLDSPRVAAEMLLGHVLGLKRLELYLDPERPASDLERATFRGLVERALKHEPVDYLVGQALFMGMVFQVTRAVLVPRPSTEALVEHVLQHARITPGFSHPLVADVGTGSGAIAVSIAKHLPLARVIATDLYKDALDVARENAQRHGVADRIEFREGDLLEPLKGERLQYLLSNPPYIPDEEWEAEGGVAPNVKEHEPTHALRGGADGMLYIDQLIENGPKSIETPGQLVLEFSASRKAAVLAKAADNPLLGRCLVLPDHERLPRVLVGERV